jgi:hypothetical protein
VSTLLSRPVTRAPIAIRQRTKSAISGSRAAFGRHRSNRLVRIFVSVLPSTYLIKDAAI